MEGVEVRPNFCPNNDTKKGLPHAEEWRSLPKEKSLQVMGCSSPFYCSVANPLHNGWKYKFVRVWELESDAGRLCTCKQKVWQYSHINGGHDILLRCSTSFTLTLSTLPVSPLKTMVTATDGSGAKVFEKTMTFSLLGLRVNAVKARLEYFLLSNNKMTKTTKIVLVHNDKKVQGMHLLQKYNDWDKMHNTGKRYFTKKAVRSHCVCIMSVFIFTPRCGNNRFLFANQCAVKTAPLSFVS